MSYVPYQAICLFATNALPTWTGTTGETSLKTFTVKGGTVGPNDRLEYIMLLDLAGGQTTVLKMGATTFLNNNTAATISIVRKGNINFKNSVASQIMVGAVGQTDATSSTVALLTATEDFANDVVFDIRSNLGVVGSTFNLRSFCLNLWKAPTLS